MSSSSTVRFDSRKVAAQISAINGGSPKTVKVRMVGKEDVKKLIDKMEVARNTPPTSRLRAR